MRYVIPVVDLFAGPGGLGEGFTAFQAEGLHRATFKIAISIEKDAYAHRTLELRSFFRKFAYHSPPDDYYDYLRGGNMSREALFAAWPTQARAARREARKAELGNGDNERIYEWIEEALATYHAPYQVLIGGPPCQAYSLAGRSRRRSDPTFKTDQKHTLYREYLRILARFRPSVFVMENVKGLLSSKLDGEQVFQRILKDLKNPEAAVQEAEQSAGNAGQADGETLTYRIYSLVVPTNDPDTLHPTDFIIRAEEFGIPQARHRVILLGVRSDLDVVPKTLTRFKEAIPACAVLNQLPPLRSSLSKRKSHEDLKDSETIWRQIISEVLDQKWFQDLPLEKPNLFAEYQEQLANSIRASVEDLQYNLTPGGEYTPGIFPSHYLPDWYDDPRLGGMCNHMARSHMATDLHRYLFAACYARVYKVSPKMRDFPSALLPNHDNIQAARDKGEEEDFNDRFRVQVADRPATTITAHIHKDGHYNIHFDPTQCRSLTVREAARLQTFPDNYFFEGPRTQQYLQVGNAVPPYLAYQIAGVVYDLLEQLDAPKRRRHR